MCSGQISTGKDAQHHFIIREIQTKPKHLIPIRMVGILKLERKIASVDEDMEKLELLDVVSGKTEWFIRF